MVSVRRGLGVGYGGVGGRGLGDAVRVWARLGLPRKGLWAGGRARGFQAQRGARAAGWAPRAAPSGR